MNGIGILKHVDISSWPSMFHLIALMKRGDRWISVESGMKTGYGLADHHTLRGWKVSVQQGLHKSMVSNGDFEVGDKDEVVVFDETVMGVHQGVNTRTNRDRSSSGSKAHRRGRVWKRLPGRTILKNERPGAPAKRPAQATTMKKPAAPIHYNKGKARTDRDPRHNGMWVWLAVTVGKGSTRYTHAIGLKRITYCVLPRKNVAPQGRPRGAKSIRRAATKFIKKR